MNGRMGIACAAAVLALLLTASAAQAQADAPLFSDPRMISAIKKALPMLPPDVDAGYLEIADIPTLDLSEAGIESLGGIERLTRLEQLNLLGNHVSDLTPLLSLSNLRRLNLAGNRVEDISPLAALPRLEYLVLDRNPLADLSPLLAMVSLRYLGLNYLGLGTEDLVYLEFQPQLRILGLDGNQIASAHSLAGLAELEELYLRGNRLTDIGALLVNPGLGGADTVHLDGNPLSQQAICVDLPRFVGRFAAPRQVSHTGTCLGTAALSLEVRGGGRVTPDPGIHTVALGGTVEVSACRNCEGVFFSHWEGDATGDALALTLRVERDARVVAVFEPAECTLEIVAEGGGSVVPAPGRYGHRKGDLAALSALPSAEAAFAGWEGAATGTENPVRITLTGDAKVLARFVPGDHTLTVELRGEGVLRPGPGRYRFLHGAPAIVRVCPGCTAQVFSHWEGDTEGGELEARFVMDRDRRIVGVFKAPEASPPASDAAAPDPHR